MTGQVGARDRSPKWWKLVRFPVSGVRWGVRSVDQPSSRRLDSIALEFTTVDGCSSPLPKS